MLDRLYSESNDDFAVVSMTWSRSSCDESRSTSSIENTSSYSRNFSDNFEVASAIYDCNMFAKTSSMWYSLADASKISIIIKAYTDFSLFNALTKSWNKSILYVYASTLKRQILLTISITISLSVNIDSLNIKGELSSFAMT